MDRKEKSREKMIGSAKALFEIKGIGKTTMEDIGKRADLTRRTVYRHFESKDEIAHEVIIKALKDWNLVQDHIVSHVYGTGYQKLEQYLRALAEIILDTPSMIRLYKDFDHHYSDDNPYEPPEQIRNRFMETAHYSEVIIEDLVNQGLKDGSIQLFEDKALTIITISYVLWGMAQHLYNRRLQTQKEFGVDVKDMFECQLQFYLKGIEAVK